MLTNVSLELFLSCSKCSAVNASAQEISGESGPGEHSLLSHFMSIQMAAPDPIPPNSPPFGTSELVGIPPLQLRPGQPRVSVSDTYNLLLGGRPSMESHLRGG